MPTHYQGSPQAVLALDTFIKLTRVTNSVMNRLAGHETLKDITISQFGVLETLLHLGRFRKLKFVPNSYGAVATLPWWSIILKSMAWCGARLLRSIVVLPSSTSRQREKR